MITAMNFPSTLVLPIIALVLVMLAPYVVAAALSAALPGWRRRMGDVPSTGEMVVRFFDGPDLDGTQPRRGSDARRSSGW
jgi:hypothetical protein